MEEAPKTPRVYCGNLFCSQKLLWQLSPIPSAEEEHMLLVASVYNVQNVDNPRVFSTGSILATDKWVSHFLLYKVLPFNQLYILKDYFPGLSLYLVLV